MDLGRVQGFSAYEIAKQNGYVGTEAQWLESLHGPKGADGAPGKDGADGASAGFGTPMASVDANVGTPSVTIEASGSNAAKVFKFTFKNLKGEKGDKGERGPAGSVVVDNALSSTSVNPVQNKVVKAEFDQVNSNLDTLEYSDIAGGKNLLRYKFKQGHYSISTKTPILLKAGKYTISGMTNDDKLFYVLRYVDGKYVDNAVAQSIGTVTSHQFTLSSDMYACFQINATDIDANYYNNSVMIEEGTQATPYEPYIPSVKMLAEEVNEQNESLGDYGLYNKFEGSVTYNYWYNKKNGEYQSSSTSATLTNKTNCSEGNIVRVMCPSATNVSIVFYNSSNEFISGTDKDGTDVQFIAPTNASYCRINFYKSGGFGGNIGKIGVYINNAIDELKNDLSNLKDGTTPVAKATKADTATSAQTAAIATKASQDGEGNNIAATYAKKTEIPGGGSTAENVTVVAVSGVSQSVVNNSKCKNDRVVLGFYITVAAGTYNTIRIADITSDHGPTEVVYGTAICTTKYSGFDEYTKPYPFHINKAKSIYLKINETFATNMTFYISLAYDI